jgi:hypothetical protein
MKSLRLDRRTFLRGTGVAIALPTLEAMLDSKGRVFGSREARAASAMPPRLITFHFPHGVIRKYWEPSATGTGYPMSPSLMALEPFRNDINIVTGLSNPTGFDAMGGGQHAQGFGTFANACTVTSKGAGGPTMEQVAAAQFGGSTKFRTLVINNEQPISNGDDFTTAHTNNISWSAKETYVPAIRDPSELFRQLFSTPVSPPSGSGTTTPPTTGVDVAAQRKKSILDYVAAQTGALSQKLGGDDKARIDQHLTSIRELERQLVTPPTTTPPPAGSGCVQPATPGTGLAPDQRAYVNLKLLATALSCGLTRYASFAMANGFLTTTIPGFPAIKEFHAYTHRETGATDEDVAAVVPYWVDKLVYFINLLKTSADDATSTVLDNSIVFFSSEMALGTHYRDPMPVVLAGKAGGALKTGRHLSYPDVAIERLLFTIMKLAGTNVTKFGNGGTSPLSELLA